jgi:hypothetical protein
LAKQFVHSRAVPDDSIVVGILIKIARPEMKHDEQAAPNTRWWCRRAVAGSWRVAISNERAEFVRESAEKER